MKYYEFAEVISQIEGILERNQIDYIDIEWCWDYQGNDSRDTLEGNMASSYSFEISLVTVNLL